MEGKKKNFCLYYLIFVAVVVIFEWFMLPIRNAGNADTKKFGVLVYSFFNNAGGLTNVILLAGAILSASILNCKSDSKNYLFKVQILTIIVIVMLYLKVMNFGSDLGRIFVYAGEKDWTGESYIKFMDWMTYLKDAACLTLLILALILGKPFSLIGFKIDDLKIVKEDSDEEKE